MKTLRFCFDVQCPYAYLGSLRVEQIASAANVPLEIYPVLLGGLYRNTDAPQGKDGSATSVMPPAKVKLTSDDLLREASRANAELDFNKKHPIKSVKAQRLLVGLKHRNERLRMMKRLYRAYWTEQCDVSLDSELERLAAEVNVNILGGSDAAATATATTTAATTSSSSSLPYLWDIEENKAKLHEHTKWASDRGVFGVPAFFIVDDRNGEALHEGRFWFGQDRFFFVARALGVDKSHPMCHPARLTLQPQASNPTLNRKKTIYFYHDFASPWSFLASTQIERVAKDHNAEVCYRPILLGKVFKEIGTPNVPMLSMSNAKREYFALDMKDWMEYWGTESTLDLKFPESFPIRTVTPLRVSIARPEPKIVNAIYRATWNGNTNTGDAEELKRVLQDKGKAGAGLSPKEAEQLVDVEAQDAKVKEQLKSNTDEAVAVGVIGVPSFVVELEGVGRSDVVWGQDRLNVVSDMLDGVQPLLRNAVSNETSQGSSNASGQSSSMSPISASSASSSVEKRAKNPGKL